MRKKIFLLLACSLSFVFLFFSLTAFLLFRTSLIDDIDARQYLQLKATAHLVSNYINSLDMIPFQLVNDEQIGTCLSTTSADEFKVFRAKNAICNTLKAQQMQLQFSSKLSGELSFFVNPDVPLSSGIDASGLADASDTQTCQVYSSRNVETDDWYQKTQSANWSPYFFLCKKSKEIYYAKSVYSYYQNPPLANGYGIVVIGIGKKQFTDTIFNKVVTPDSSLLLVNKDGMVLCSRGSVPTGISKKTVAALTRTDDKKATAGLYHPDSGHSTSITVSKGNYIKSTIAVDDGLHLISLTPYTDVLASIRHSMLLFMTAALGTYIMLLAIICLLTRKIASPIITFSNMIGKIADPRSFEADSLKTLQARYPDRELRILFDSFTDLLQREKVLIEQIDMEGKAKRAAIQHALQAQINPHFLYNALDIVSWKALSDNEDSIAEMISAISDMMHYSISQPDAMVPVCRELEYVRKYIDLYQMETLTDVNLTVTAGDDGILKDFLIPKFILQPLVENSLQHNPDLEALDIQIKFISACDGLTITITDNGIGADPAQLNSYLNYKNSALKVHGGLGIRNVNERLQLYYSSGSSISYNLTKDHRLCAIIHIVPPPSHSFQSNSL